MFVFNVVAWEFMWARSQVPKASWPVPRFNLWGPVFLPSRSLTVGPAFIAGDCLSSGIAFRYLFSLTASCVNMLQRNDP